MSDQGDPHGPGGSAGHHDFTGPMPPGVARFLKVFLVVCGILLLLDLAGIKRDDQIHLAAEGWFAFYPLYGFIGCVTLVLVAKEMRKLVMRPEDHYEPPEEMAVDPDEGRSAVGGEWGGDVGDDAAARDRDPDGGADGTR